MLCFFGLPHPGLTDAGCRQIAEQNPAFLANIHPNSEMTFP